MKSNVCDVCCARDNDGRKIWPECQRLVEVDEAMVILHTALLHLMCFPPGCSLEPLFLHDQMCAYA